MFHVSPTLQAIELFDMIEGTYIGVDDWNASVRLTNLVRTTSISR